MSKADNVVRLPVRKQVGEWATISYPPGDDSCMVQGRITAVHPGGEVTIDQRNPFKRDEFARGVPN